jgi:hypothetical protein
VTAVAAARPMTKRHLLRVRGKIHRSLAEPGLAGTLAYVPRYIVVTADHRFRIYTVAPPAGARANSEDLER